MTGQRHRDADGRFAEGNPGGPGGRPRYATPEAFAEAVARAARTGGHQGHHAYSIGQLARAMGFAGREGLRLYEARPGYRLALAAFRLTLAERRADGARQSLANLQDAQARLDAQTVPPRLRWRGRRLGWQLEPWDDPEHVRVRLEVAERRLPWAEADLAQARARFARLEAEDGPLGG